MQFHQASTQTHNDFDIPAFDSLNDWIQFHVLTTSKLLVTQHTAPLYKTSYIPE